MKVLHLPTITGGHAFGLAQGERAIGIDACVLATGKTRFAYPVDILRDLENKNLLQQFFGRLAAFLKYRQGFDVYHFNFGSTLLHAPMFGLNLFDLPFYDRDAKKIFTYQGCDARQKYPTIERNKALGSEMAACFRENCNNGVCNSGKRDIWRQKAIDKATEYADHIFALNPDLMYFLPKEKASFLPYAMANFADIPIKEAVFFENDKIRIMHAPTQRVTKGTDYVLTALEELKTEFDGRIEIHLIENMPNAEALKKYQQADLFIDQMLVGWYGGVAVEVMKMGIPVAVFINDDHLQFVPSEMVSDLPFLRVTIYDLKEKIRDFIKNRDMAIELGRKSLSYVEKWHDPVKIARITESVYCA